MAFSDAYLEELAARNDIADVVGSYVRLSKKSGQNLFGLCPFHSERTPSFSVSPQKQIYHCFGCGKGGGVISFIMEIEQLSFREAVAFLASRAGMPLPEDEGDNAADVSRRKRMIELNTEAARFWFSELKSPAGAPAIEYIQKRALTNKTVVDFGLGFARDSWDALCTAMRQKGYTDRELLDAGLAKQGKKGGVYDAFRSRLMFPVIDVRGSVIGFSGRIIGEGEPKYLNTPETLVFSKSRNLFALNLAKKTKSGYLILTEGNIDVASLHQAGFDCAVASLGTSLTAEQARLMSRYVQEVILCYDSDGAGKKATDRAISILGKLDMKVRVLRLPGAKDPDEFIRQNGADAFRNLLEGSAGQMDFRLDELERQFPLDTDDGRVNYLKASARLLASVFSPVEREVYAARVAEKCGVTKEALLREAERIRKAKQRESAKQLRSENTRPASPPAPGGGHLHYRDPRSAKAEEGLIRLLLLDPSLASEPTLPAPEQFSEESLGRVYGVLLRRAREGSSLSPAVLVQEFSPEEQSIFTRVTALPEDVSNSTRALRDYIDVILKRLADPGEDLRALQTKLKKTKGYGG